MKIHNFRDEDLRILADLAIDFFTDDMLFKVVRIIDKKENYWSIDCRFALKEEELETCYDSLQINSGRNNEPETYQMSWTRNRGDVFTQKPISCPLLVVAYFQEMCKKETLKMN